MPNLEGLHNFLPNYRHLVVCGKNFLLIKLGKGNRDTQVSYCRKIVGVVSFRTILENNLGGTFPNIEIALRMYLSLMVSNSSEERSFFKIKFLKKSFKDKYGTRTISQFKSKFRIRYHT